MARARKLYEDNKGVAQRELEQAIQVGQAVEVRVMAYPERRFSGKITAIGATIDSNTHRVTTRSEVSDPQHELRPGMVATFTICIRKDGETTATPVNAVVREGDGTMTAWVTTDHRHFSQRTLKVGQQRGGWRQILDGLKPEELVVTSEAVFLSNLLQAPPTD
ncbi:MAG: efflux RND transporter periplasmic adaptor subunit [Verrucomicrobiota bacterium]